MIVGETGCGKELVANAIHSNSVRSKEPFVAVNCASIPASLFESEMFGYEEGSFTGAIKGGRKGKFENADQGTLFLDEIDQLPLEAQPKLLRVLQEKEIQRVGSSVAKPIDVRIICATNKDLNKMVAEGEFREDLFYRINVIEIPLTPLRERKEDIPIIAERSIQKINRSIGRQERMVVRIDQVALKLLCMYDWPGNVRALQNVLERAMNRCYEETLKVEHFKNFFSAESMEAVAAIDVFPLEKTLEQIEKEAIVRTYIKYNKNKTEVAKILGITRDTLYKKLKKYDIK